MFSILGYQCYKNGSISFSLKAEGHKKVKRKKSERCQVKYIHSDPPTGHAIKKVKFFLACLLFYFWRKRLTSKKKGEEAVGAKETRLFFIRPESFFFEWKLSAEDPMWPIGLIA